VCVQEMARFVIVILCERFVTREGYIFCDVVSGLSREKETLFAIV
jgi:hypothetical protein